MEFNAAEEWLKTGNFYDCLASAVERDKCMRERMVGDYAYLLPDVGKVRSYLRDKASMIFPYEWMDNSAIQAKIREMANMRYKTGSASDAEKAAADLGIDELRDYVRDLIKTDMTVGIAILKRQKHFTGAPLVIYSVGTGADIGRGLAADVRVPAAVYL